MPERIPERLWIEDYYGHAPFPGGRIVNRVPVAGAEQPWAARAVRHVSQRWLGPVQINAQGVVFNVRYVGVHEHAGRGAYPLHVHPHSELLFTLAGHGSVRFPDRQPPEACAPGHFVVLPPGCAHQTAWALERNRSWRTLVVDFDLALDPGQTLSESGEAVDLAFAPFYEHFYVRGDRGFRLDAQDRAPALAVLGGIADALGHRRYGICADIVAGLLRTIATLSRGLRRRGLSDGRRLLPAPLSRDATLLLARNLLEQDDGRDAGDVARIARQLGLSAPHFIREFKRAFGTPPMQYRLHALMRRAAALLTGTDVSVKEAAFQVGYGDPASFSRAFRRHFGLAPAEFRRRNRPAPSA